MRLSQQLLTIRKRRNLRLLQHLLEIQKVQAERAAQGVIQAALWQRVPASLRHDNI